MSEHQPNGLNPNSVSEALLEELAITPAVNNQFNINVDELVSNLDVDVPLD